MADRASTSASPRRPSLVSLQLDDQVPRPRPAVSRHRRFSDPGSVGSGFIALVVQKRAWPLRHGGQLVQKHKLHSNVPPSVRTIPRNPQHQPCDRSVATHRGLQPDITIHTFKKMAFATSPSRSRAVLRALYVQRFLTSPTTDLRGVGRDTSR